MTAPLIVRVARALAATRTAFDRVIREHTAELRDIERGCIEIASKLEHAAQALENHDEPKAIAILIEAHDLEYDLYGETGIAQAFTEAVGLAAQFNAADEARSNASLASRLAEQNALALDEYAKELLKDTDSRAVAIMLTKGDGTSVASFQFVNDAAATSLAKDAADLIETLRHAIATRTNPKRTLQ
jgi:hypothetical protein